MRRLDAEGRLAYSPNGMPRYKRYLDEMPGVTLQDMWSDIKPTQGKERSGYSTQKPLALHERIIKASSNEGDWVLDPFAGCATTPIASERLGRKWVGIDIWDKAHPTVLERLEKEGLAVPQSDAAQRRRRREHPLSQAEVGSARAARPKMTRAEMFDRLVEEWGACASRLQPPVRRRALLAARPQHAALGLNHISNRMLMCGHCNRIKSNTLTLSGLRRENRRRGRMAKQ